MKARNATGWYWRWTAGTVRQGAHIRGLTSVTKPRSTDETRLEGVAIVRSCAHRSLLQAAGEPRIPRNTKLIWLRERQGGAPLNLG